MYYFLCIISMCLNAELITNIVDFFYQSLFKKLTYHMVKKNISLSNYWTNFIIVIFSLLLLRESLQKEIWSKNQHFYLVQLWLILNTWKLYKKFHLLLILTKFSLNYFKTKKMLIISLLSSISRNHILV